MTNQLIKIKLRKNISRKMASLGKSYCRRWEGHLKSGIN